MWDSILVRNVKAGDEILEDDYGRIFSKALEDAHPIDNGFGFRAEIFSGGTVGEIIDYFQDATITHYGPHIYKKVTK